MSQFFFYVNGQTTGPYSIEQVAQMFGHGQVTAYSMCSCGNDAWELLKNRPEFGQIQGMTMASQPMGMVPPPPPPPPPPPMPAQPGYSPGAGVPGFGPGAAYPAMPMPIQARPATVVAGTEPAQPRLSHYSQGLGQGRVLRAVPVHPTVRPVVVRRVGAQAIPVSNFSFVASPTPPPDGADKEEKSLESSKPEAEVSETSGWNQEAETAEDLASPKILCPHCWQSFRLTRMMYISRHPDLLGDDILGAAAQKRFLPKRFTGTGEALDEKNIPCSEMACPRCHLPIAENLLKYSSQLFSIVGAPSAGKSYFLAAMLHCLKTTMVNFQYSVMDAAVEQNMVLSRYEELLFQRSREKIVALPKTELTGSDFANDLEIDGVKMTLPLPFVYTLSPVSRGSGEDQANAVQNLVFYDNAGEQFEPGRGWVNNLATNHLLKSSAIFFLFDPFKDSRTIDDCTVQDPQAGNLLRSANQLQVFNEMLTRIRRQGNLADGEYYPSPLFVIVPKYDAWKDSFALDLKDTPRFAPDASGQKALNVSTLLVASWLLRDWLRRRVPELVPLAENFFQEVYYIPVSALGQSPILDKATDMLGVVPGKVHPIWADTPMLIQLWRMGIITGINTEVADNVRPADEFCHFQDGKLFFTPPKRITQLVPAVFWGEVVHDDELGFIRFPAKSVETESDEPPASEEAGSALPDASDDDFWNTQIY